MTIQFVDGNVLFTSDGKIAMGSECCCDDVESRSCGNKVCDNTPKTLYYSFNFTPKGGALNDSTYAIYDCVSKTTTIKCNLLPTDRYYYPRYGYTYNGNTYLALEFRCYVFYADGSGDYEQGYYGQLNITIVRPFPLNSGDLYCLECPQGFDDGPDLQNPCDTRNESLVYGPYETLLDANNAIPCLNELGDTLYDDGYRSIKTSGSAGDISNLFKKSTGFCHCEDGVNWPTGVFITLGGFTEYTWYDEDIPGDYTTTHWEVLNGRSFLLTEIDVSNSGFRSFFVYEDVEIPQNGVRFGEGFSSTMLIYVISCGLGTSTSLPCNRRATVDWNFSQYISPPVYMCTVPSNYTCSDTLPTLELALDYTPDYLEPVFYGSYATVSLII